MARKAGISHGYLRTLEHGINPTTEKIIMPSPETLKSLAAAYDYPYEKLLKAAGYLDDGTSMECSVINGDVIRIPICSDIINGRGIIVDYGYLPRRMSDDTSLLFLMIKDNTMVCSRSNKNLALVRWQNHVEENKIGVFEIKDNGTVIRRVKYDGEDIILTTDTTLHEKRYHNSRITTIGEVELFIIYTS
jgi:transcriptional regulator with XRE-family HTH domain